MYWKGEVVEVSSVQFVTLERSQHTAEKQKAVRDIGPSE
jgi:hypothetical protein